jgi:uncharacterized phage protein gp47/JayE
MADYVRPSLETLITQVMGDIRTRTEGTQLMRRSLERLFGYAFAGVAHGLHGRLDAKQRALTPVGGEIELLREWGEMLELPQKGGTPAVGAALLERNGGAVVIPSGAAMVSDAGLRYAATAPSTTYDATHVSVAVRALDIGEATNLEQGSALRLVQPIATIGDGAAQADFTGGTDAERLERYRSRIVTAARRRSLGGIAGNYEEWALKVDGVTRAWERPHRYGLGTVSVAFTMDDRSNVIPTPSDVAMVQGYLDAKRPLDMRAVYVVAPVAKPVSMTIRLKPNTPTVRAAVTTALSELFAEAAFEEPIAQSQVDEVISTAPGEVSHTLAACSSLNPGTWGLLTLGAVTYQDEV